MISPPPQVYAGPDTAICTANGRYLLSNQFVVPPGGVWVPLTFTGNMYPGILSTPSNAIIYSKSGDSVFFDPAATGIIDSVYGVIYSYKSPAPTGCTNSDTVYIKVSSPRNAHWTMNYSGNAAWFHALDSSMFYPAYHWDFGDGKTATGPNVKHIFPANKSYKTTLTVDWWGCITSFDSTLAITKSGVDQPVPVLTESLSVFPNPFNSSANVQYVLSKKSGIQIVLYDITGRQIAMLVNETPPPGLYNFEINADKYHLGQGVYLLKLITGDGTISRQIVKL
jgi:hypothetical protein